MFLFLVFCYFFLIVLLGTLDSDCGNSLRRGLNLVVYALDGHQKYKSHLLPAKPKKSDPTPNSLSRPEKLFYVWFNFRLTDINMVICSVWFVPVFQFLT